MPSPVHSPGSCSKVLLKNLGQQPYLPVWQAMQKLTRERTRPGTSEIWTVEHPPVFTLGQAGKPEHLLNPGDIPVINTDRGGQVTYHGPGQLVVYTLLDLHELGIGVRSLVEKLEQSVIQFLQDLNIPSQAKRSAPGVYVDEKKIAALGLKIRKGFSYHGLSFNIDMDLEPFSRINPCGYQGLEVTQLKDLGINMTPDQVAQELIIKMAETLAFEITTHD